MQKKKDKKEEDKNRQKNDKKTKDKDQKESSILRRQGSFALLRCFEEGHISFLYLQLEAAGIAYPILI